MDPQLAIIDVDILSFIIFTSLSSLNEHI